MNSDVTTREQCRPEIERLTRERDEARALLLDCWKAIYTAIGCEDGLDGGEGMSLLERIEAVCPEAKAFMGRINRA